MTVMGWLAAMVAIDSLTAVAAGVLLALVVGLAVWGAGDRPARAPRRARRYRGARAAGIAARHRADATRRHPPRRARGDAAAGRRLARPHAPADFLDQLSGDHRWGLGRGDAQALAADLQACLRGARAFLRTIHVGHGARVLTVQGERRGEAVVLWVFDSTVTEGEVGKLSTELAELSQAFDALTGLVLVGGAAADLVSRRRPAPRHGQFRLCRRGRGQGRRRRRRARGRADRARRAGAGGRRRGARQRPAAGADAARDDRRRAPHAEAPRRAAAGRRDRGLRGRRRGAGTGERARAPFRRGATRDARPAVGGRGAVRPRPQPRLLQPAVPPHVRDAARVADRPPRVRSRTGADARGQSRARGARLSRLEGGAARLVPPDRGRGGGGVAPARRHSTCASSPSRCRTAGCCWCSRTGPSRSSSPAR
ncbi:hypothetical protein AB5I41_25500 [Sphingomonas sp. MMS24-JH45]